MYRREHGDEEDVDVTAESDKLHTVREGEGDGQRLGETREPCARINGSGPTYEQGVAKQRAELMHTGHIGAENPSVDPTPLVRHPPP